MYKEKKKKKLWNLNHWTTKESLLLQLLSHFSRVRPHRRDPTDGSPPGPPVSGILQAKGKNTGVCRKSLCISNSK